MIDDARSAIDEANRFLKKEPDSSAVRLALLKALCKAGDEIEALSTWNGLITEDKDLVNDRATLEALSWGVINKGEQSSQLNVKVNALIGACITRDAKAIPLILNALRGSNAMIRAIAVGLAAAYGDLPLQQEIGRMLKEETVWSVRLELIKAAGQLRMRDTKPRLVEIIGHPRTLAEEKVAAIVSLVTMYDQVEDRELANLIRSNRAGLRELACQIISHLDLCDKAEMLLPLAADAHPSVRISVLNTLALLGVKELEGTPIMRHQSIKRLLNDPVPEVMATAGWLALIHKDPKGEQILEKMLLKKEGNQAQLAAGALMISGKHGIPLIKKGIKRSNNPYVQTTLALGLIGQREDVEQACEIIQTHLQRQERLMWDRSLNPLFRFIAQSRVTHNPQTPNYPQVVDQMTRLELLQILSKMGYDKALDAIKAFLRTNSWGATGAAAVTLLQEGDEQAMDLIRELLDDNSEKIRLQAALILALFGKDVNAVKVLKEAYHHAGRELKLHILEALTKVGDPATIEFLLERLDEPFQVLRVVAATGIIQCLYH